MATLLAKLQSYPDIGERVEAEHRAQMDLDRAQRKKFKYRGMGIITAIAAGVILSIGIALAHTESDSRAALYTIFFGLPFTAFVGARIFFLYRKANANLIARAWELRSITEAISRGKTIQEETLNYLIERVTLGDEECEALQIPQDLRGILEQLSMIKARLDGVRQIRDGQELLRSTQRFDRQGGQRQVIAARLGEQLHSLVDLLPQAIDQSSIRQLESAWKTGRSEALQMLEEIARPRPLHEPIEIEMAPPDEEPPAPPDSLD